MEILYKSFHIVDIDQYICKEMEISDDFEIFLKDYVEFANNNEKNKEYILKNEESKVYQYIESILEKEETRDKQSYQIANVLLECEKVAQGKIFQMGTNVKRGSLIQILSKTDEKYQYILAKAEYTKWYDGNDLKEKFGFAGDKNLIWKSAIFTFYELNGVYLLDSIKVYDDNKSKYWHLSFLELEEKRDDFSNTYAAYKAIDAELKSNLKDKSVRDYTILSDELQKTMNQPQEFVFTDYVDDLMEGYEPSSEDIEKDVIKECLLALPQRKKFDNEFKTVPQSIVNKRTKKYKIANGVELTIKSDAIDFTSRIVSTMVDGQKVLQIYCEDEDTYASFIED